MTPSYDVVAIGNAIVDVIADATDGFLAGEGLHKGAMKLVDEDEAQRLYAAMGPGRETSGGSAANTVAGTPEPSRTSRRGPGTGLKGAQTWSFG